MSNINDASLANLKHYEGKWKHGQTRTIRVPIALAEATLEYARQLDKGVDLRGTNLNIMVNKKLIQQLQADISALAEAFQKISQEQVNEPTSNGATTMVIYRAVTDCL